MNNDIKQWKEIEARVLAERYIEFPKRSEAKPFDYEAQARVRVPITSRWILLSKYFERVLSQPEMFLHHLTKKGGSSWDCPACTWQCNN